MSARPAPSIALRGLLLLALVGTAGCKKTEAAKPAEAAAVLTVSTQPVALRELPQKLDLTGAVAAWDPMPVMPAANGLRIMQVLAEEGDVVGKGQLLARLDDATLQAQLAAARARATSSRAQLAKMRQPSRRQDLAGAVAVLAQADATVHSAQDAYDRFSALQAEGGVSAIELVARQSSLDAAKAAAEQARQRLSLAREGSRSEDLRIAEAQTAETSASVAQMEALVAQTRVTAPAGGQIVKRDAHLGDVSAVGRALFQMVRESRLQVEALVPETDMGRVRPGQVVTVTSDARPELSATGKVRSVSPQVDSNSRQAMVKIDLPVGSGFQVGMFVRTRVTMGMVSTLAVPAAALVAKESGSEVFVLENGLAKSRAVIPGIRAQEWVGISSGLKAGDAVITAGVGFLKDGDKVDVAPALTDVVSPHP